MAGSWIRRMYVLLPASVLITGSVYMNLRECLPRGLQTCVGLMKVSHQWVGPQYVQHCPAIHSHFDSASVLFSISSIKRHFGNSSTGWWYIS
ncbi:uncharacterized protein BJ212DRAFT_1405313 [Suillus subaureus]|uniref:Secreted protein n=1 Tax=Suillus subaureus TaxID=48587 RepID=A0A9P7DLA8_9AGAM|nr:uncharacterized protein BJ212DRAFT_1405313 [Suillus subaureus]KAG1797643.1 hypothetical protein BJ212DRAFT_1405313 [Suillus subaureus]